MPLQSRSSGNTGCNGKQHRGAPSMRLMGRTSSGISVPTSTFSASQILRTQQQLGERGLSATARPPEQGKVLDWVPAVWALRQTEWPESSKSKQQQQQQQQQLPIRRTYRRPSTVGSPSSSSSDISFNRKPLPPLESSHSCQYCHFPATICRKEFQDYLQAH